MSHPILLIEDDVELANSVAAMILKELGIEVRIEQDGQTGYDAAIGGGYCAIIVDGQLPHRSGFDICREVRQKYPVVPIVMLTAKNEEIDRVLGLELGADDYISKPFSSRELIARLRGILRRASATEAVAHSEKLQSELQIGPLRIDKESRRVWIDGQLVSLTLIEFELLYLLASNPGCTVSRDDLVQLVLGYQGGNYSTSLTVHLSRLRAKLEVSPSATNLILTVRGVGYRFAAPDELPL